MEEPEEKDTVLAGVAPLEKAGTQQGVQLQKWELPRVLNLEKESSEHLKRTHLKLVQHCTVLLLQVTLPAHTGQGMVRPGLG